MIDTTAVSDDERYNSGSRYCDNYNRSVDFPVPIDFGRGTWHQARVCVNEVELSPDPVTVRIADDDLAQVLRLDPGGDQHRQEKIILRLTEDRNEGGESYLVKLRSEPWSQVTVHFDYPTSQISM